jgi:arginyl-tRNA synthetase
MSNGMADPLDLLAQRFADAFAALAGSPVDPVVRPSEHADAQVNGAL